MATPGDARRLAAERIGALRHMSYAELRSMMPRTKRRLLGGRISLEVGGEGPLHEEIGDLQVETDLFWDGEEDGAIRVSVTVWRPDGRRPWATEDFIVAPDGTFVGE